MNKSGNVIIGFGNSQGRISKTLLEEKYHVIERLNVKPSTSLSKIRIKDIPQIDLGIYKNLISKRRNQILLQSFIGLNEVENEDEVLYNLRDDATKQIRSIESELDTLIVLAGEVKQGKFMTETKAS
jgi:hypothetical protein